MKDLRKEVFCSGEVMVNIDRKPKRLTSSFFTAYAACPEILRKSGRQYCIALLLVDNIKFAIPFRTNIGHNHCYLFSNSPRGANSGLDFTKAVVITDETYIGQDAIIENAEYSEFINKQKVIANRFENFIDDYKKWVKDPIYYHEENVVAFSSLQYFHKELGI